MISPLSRSTQTADSFLPSAVALVSQICLPQMTGDDHALPGMAVFQTTFSLSLHLIGRPRADDRPSPLGPRTPGQLPSARQEEAMRKSGRMARRDMGSSKSVGCGPSSQFKESGRRVNEKGPRKTAAPDTFESRSQRWLLKPTPTPTLVTGCGCSMYAG